MRRYRTDVPLVVLWPSSDGKRQYSVNLTAGQCSCPAMMKWRWWEPCKHLLAARREGVTGSGRVVV